MFPPNTRFLVVDDSKIAADLVDKYLRELGYSEIITALNGEAAFQVLQERHEKQKPIDFIFSDWDMPVMTGIDLLKKIRSTATFKDVHFVMVTGNHEQDPALQALTEGASSFIFKPLTRNVLKEKLENVWGQSNQA